MLSQWIPVPNDTSPNYLARQLQMENKDIHTKVAWNIYIYSNLNDT